MLRLASTTPADWVARVAPHLDVILLDHAHCEKKAASSALQLIFRYQHFPELMVPLSALAREELEHFEMVLAILDERDIAFRRLRPSPYARALHEAVRDNEPQRLLDMLLVGALIEARSCERMKLLSEHLEDPVLRALYAGLLASEARHHATYVDLALGRFDRDEVFSRLGELAAHEAAVLEAPSDLPRLHTQASPHQS